MVEYTISETAERTKLSHRTIRYYEEKFNLDVKRGADGRRTYTDDNLDLLESIVELKGKGLSLDGIKTILEQKGHISPAAKTDLIQIDEKSLELKEYILNDIIDAVDESIKVKLEPLLDHMRKTEEDNQLLKSSLAEMKILIQEQSKNDMTAELKELKELFTNQKSKKKMFSFLKK